LNLAMAVQIVAYELRMLQMGGQAGVLEDADWDTPFSKAEDMARFYEHLETTLVDIGFLDPAAPKQLMPRLNRLFNRVRLDEMELNILRGILTETQNAASRSKD
jgi:tRNA (cytidine32/uridine32-2'-O)-methyltransferase